MSEMVQIILYGSLRDTGTETPNPSKKLWALDETTPLKNIIRQLDIQVDKVQLVMLNHRAVLKNTNIKPGDRLVLFPTEYPMYPDWNDFRF